MTSQHIVSLFSYIVPIMFLIAYAPQLFTTYKTKNATGVSSLFWFLVSLSTAYSLFNILKTGDGTWFTYFGQFINAGVAYILVFWTNKIKTGYLNAIAITTIYTVIGSCLFILVNLEVSQTIATIAIVLAYIDQIIHFIKKKDSQGTNPLLYLFFSLGLCMLVVTMLLTNVTHQAVFTECANILLLLVCSLLSRKYSKTKIKIKYKKLLTLK